MDQSGCLGEVGEDSLIIIDVPLLDAISWWLKKKNVLYSETEFLSGHLPNNCIDSHCIYLMMLLFFQVVSPTVI